MRHSGRFLAWHSWLCRAELLEPGYFTTGKSRIGPSGGPSANPPHTPLRGPGCAYSSVSPGEVSREQALACDPRSAGAFLGNSVPEADEDTLERAIRAAIAEALVKAMASPLRDYDEWLQFVCAEAQDASHYFAFFLDGHRTIPIEWKQLKWGWTASRAFMGELPLLTGSVYIHIDLPAPIHLANGCELDGAYVRHDRTRAACRVLLAPKAGIAWPNPADHGDAFCLGLREPRGAVGEGVDNALAQAESLFTGRGIERRDTP